MEREGVGSYRYDESLNLEENKAILLEEIEASIRNAIPVLKKDNTRITETSTLGAVLPVIKASKKLRESLQKVLGVSSNDTTLFLDKLRQLFKVYIK